MATARAIAAWQRVVDRELAAYDAAWDELAASPGSTWSHPAHARIDRARDRIRALLDLRDAVQRRAGLLAPVTSSR